MASELMMPTESRSTQSRNQKVSRWYGFPNAVKVDCCNGNLSHILYTDEGLTRMNSKFIWQGLRSHNRLPHVPYTPKVFSNKYEFSANQKQPKASPHSTFTLLHQCEVTAKQ